MDTAFFIFSKIAGLCLQVETWLLIGLSLSILGGIAGLQRLAFWSSLLTLLTVLAIAIFPIGELILSPLEAEFPPPTSLSRIDGIVVLGGVEDTRATATWGQPQVNEAAERLTAATALAIQYPKARLVFSGGSGRLPASLLGAAPIPGVAVDLFTSLGINPNRIMWEATSRNTAENARFSLEAAAPAGGETWVLVTSAFHMGRALASFKAAGWPPLTPYPVDYRTGDLSAGIGWSFAHNLDILNIAIKEWVGRLAYKLGGYAS